LNYGEITLRGYWTGGWFGIRTGLDSVEKRRIPCHFRESNPVPIIISTELSRLPGTHEIGTNEVIDTFIYTIKKLCEGGNLRQKFVV
jgi:hypothetical protein